MRKTKRTEGMWMLLWIHSIRPRSGQGVAGQGSCKAPIVIAGTVGYLVPGLRQGHSNS